MIYAKDIILGEYKSKRGQVVKDIINKLKNNKMITVTVILCTILMGFDFILIHSFVRLLNML